MKISILGAGNVATNLALAFKKSGHVVEQVYNRSEDAGKELATGVVAQFIAHLNQLSDADVYILAVKDDAIAELVCEMNLGDKLLAHTSGTQSKELLNKATCSYGVFYPLQTMTKNRIVDFKQVPILIDANTDIAYKKLSDLAKSISQNVYRVDEEQRQWVHVAAVFANNFSNHLLGISQEILETHGMEFDILKPLVYSFIENIETNRPNNIQTGPAARGDKKTIEKHLQLLSDNSRLYNIYQLLTKSIIDSSHNRNADT